MKNKNTSSVKTRLLYSLAMLAVSAVVLTTASYAWFSISNQPKVEDITLTAGTFGGLTISKTNTGTFGNTVNLSTDIGNNTVLRPITTPNGKDFYKPVYGTSGKVTGVENSKVSDLTTISNKTQADGGYIASSTFYLKATGGSRSSVKVQLAAGTKVANKDSGQAAYAARIAFVLDNGTCVVFEPNADGSATGASTDQYAMASSLTTIKQSTNGKFKATSGATYSSDVSADLFEIPVDTATKVTVYIWIEGSDKDCVNEIASKVLTTSLQFTSTDLQ
ncbi:hypothetical protein [Anaerosporobacter faecicola]|uniref:hypothetical protein n=1 Tax=Anaerosporobacter faecicola TaxID=2718714 RepID=UPI00143BAA00|nr:hypothetical protein [Anaerosporobacter faecicola]